MAPRTRTVRLALGPGAVAVLLAGIAVGWFAFGAASAARRPLGWALACAIAATLLTPVVERIAERIPRPFAVLAVFVGVGAAAGALTFGVLSNLDDQVGRLKETAPEAAAELEDSGGVLGELASDADLETRIGTLIDDLEEPSSGVAAGAATSAGAWFVCVVLTAFLLSWGPRLGDAGLQQIADPDRRELVGRVVRSAVATGRRYLLGAVALAAFAGAVAWCLCDLEDVPAPVALGVAVAAGSIIPGVGVVVGAMPAVLLEAGLASGAGALRLSIGFLVLQAAHAYLLRKVVAAHSLTVGPAVVVIALVLGFQVYGVGGAYYAVALSVFGVAALDAVGQQATTGEPAATRSS